MADYLTPYSVSVEKEQAHFVVVVHEAGEAVRKQRFVRKDPAEHKAKEEIAKLQAKYSR